LKTSSAPPDQAVEKRSRYPCKTITPSEPRRTSRAGTRGERHHPASAEAPVAEENVGDTLPSLTEQLRQTELKAAEHHDAWLRAKAETENVRRRAQDDIAKASKFAADKFAQAMLPVKDSLEAALATENATLESLKQGVELTLKQLVSAFQSANVTEVNPSARSSTRTSTRPSAPSRPTASPTP
jgi:molecular chaperone GrpE